METELKLGLIHWENGIKLYLAVVAVCTRTGNLVSRSYISEDEVLNYLKYGKYYPTHITQVCLYYSASSMEDILDHITLFSVLEPERFTDHLIKYVDDIYEHSKKVRTDT